MLPRPSSNLNHNRFIFPSDQTGLEAANSSGDEALVPYTLLSDEQDSPPNTPAPVASAGAPKATLSNIRPISNDFLNILKQPSSKNQDSQITSAVAMDKRFADTNERAAILEQQARQILRNISWSGGEEFFRPAQSSFMAAVTSPKSRLPRRASPSIPALPVCSSRPSSSTGRNNVLPSHKSATNIELTAASTQSKESLNSPHPELSLSSDLSSLPSSPAPRSSGNCERVSKVKHPKNLGPPPATEPNETGQYESYTCHQCRVKTTRPKMICDQSQNPNCFSRVCCNCLLNRAVYNGIPELQPPIFQFVPGGKMLCVKCRGICPCAPCRRKRGENVEYRQRQGGGLKGSDFTPQERQNTPLKKKKKKKQDKTQGKGPSRPCPELIKSSSVVRNRPSAFVPVPPKRRKSEATVSSDDIVFLDQAPAISTDKLSQTEPAILPISSDEGSRVPEKLKCPSSERPITIQEKHTNSRREWFDRSSTEPIAIEPKRGRGRPRKENSCASEQCQQLRLESGNKCDCDTNNILAIPKRGRGRPRKETSCANQPDQSRPYKPEKDCNRTVDKTLMQINRLVRPNSEAGSGMASILHINKENTPDSKMAQYPHVERSDKQFKLKIREFELKNAADEAERLRIKSQGFEKAKMLQELLKSGLSYKEAMEATLTFLGPSA
ncbi:hypothetical protein PGT21_013286 [Puccinia graminis f. sp. tritici]|uniref:Zinc-finger domain-containing protein n=2 Tax=Puccinia graminis f. sp. tritici TaxID=56615 RepID=E3JUD9_PUCGT|nr:uncharacterized protein PGTG_00995 [Puccinia graminis f. sp. tritici CRL 75-36-700-3]EFP75664.1 hypothetical protein PGTG_00995 [Puccinia graminis f. sp. tritici CRL 75-36-700-3]KAA1116417.1 hypothetical protein PGT21_013286 [Puccinia graminis f. sp. tritici]